jgi:hypothetical protein
MSSTLNRARVILLSGSRSLAKFLVLVLVVTAFSLTSGSSATAQGVIDGGLTAPETGWSLGPNQLVNGDFSQGTTGWTLSGDFAQTNSCGESLAAHSARLIKVIFKPTRKGERSGNLPISDDAVNSPQIVDLSGKGNRR